MSVSLLSTDPPGSSLPGAEMITFSGDMTASAGADRTSAVQR